MPRPRASVFVQKLALATFVAASVAVAACGSDPARPGEPSPGNVSMETEHRVEATIGRDGGLLTTTNDAGLRFTLEVPPGAVPGDVVVSMTPVRSIGSLPFAGGLVAAVVLEPSGLFFVRPAWLEIDTFVAPGVGQQLVGFSWEEDASSFTYTGAAQAGDQVRVLVTHFSGAGVALASPEDMDDEGFVDTQEITFRAFFYPANDPEGWLDLMVEILEDDVLPGIENGSGDDLRLAVVKYFRWQELLGLDVIFGITDAYLILLDDHIIPARAVIARKLEEGIRVAKERCAFTGEVFPLTSLFEFYWQAFFLNLDTPENGLDAESVLEGICATPVIERIVLANPLPLGVDQSLDIDFALEINGALIDGVFLVDLAGIGGTVQTPRGITDASGTYTSVVRRTLEAGALFDIEGNLRLPMFDFNNTNSDYWPTLLTVEADVFRGGTADILATFPTSVSPNQPNTLALEVKQLVAPGQAEPVEGAVITLSATGGTVSPTQVATGLDGRGQVSVTAFDTAAEVVVTIVVTKDGIEIGRRDVSASVTSGALVFLRSRHSFAQVNTAPHDASCTGTDEDHDESTAAGFDSITAFADRQCNNGVDQASASATITQSSNPGVATDQRSATLTFSGSGAASGMSRPTIGAHSGAMTSLVVDFEIQGAPMAFRLEASFTASSTDCFMAFGLARDGTALLGWGKQLGDGNPPSVLLTGDLLPGNYTAAIELNGASVIGDVVATFSGNATFELTPSAAATVAITRPRLQDNP